MQQNPAPQASLTAPTLGTRLAECATKLGGKRALAKAAGLSEAQLFRYINGDCDITVGKLQALANAAQVKANWLLNGEGPIEIAPMAEHPSFDPELMQQALLQTEESLLELPSHRLSLKRKARLVSMVYEAMRHECHAYGYRPFSTSHHCLFMIEFFLGLGTEEGWNLYSRYAESFIKGENTPQLQAHEAESLADLITAAHEYRFSGVSGGIHFRQLTPTVRSGGQKRLLNLVATTQAEFPGQTPNILDIGCANGRDLAFLHQHMPHINVQGADHSARAINTCRELEKSGKLPPGCVQHGTLAQLPCGDSSMHAVQARFTMSYLPNLAEGQGFGQGLAEVARVLKPKGLAFLHLFEGEGVLLAPFIQLHTRESVEAAAHRAGLKLVSFGTYSLQEHAGTANVNQQLPGHFGSIADVVLQKI